MLSQVTATLLRANEWHEVELVAQPTKQRGWLFKAVNRDAVCFAYEVGNTICISISRFFHAAKAPKQSRIVYAGRRLSRDTEDAWSRDVGPKGLQKQSGPVPMETEISATAVDDPSQKESSDQPKRSSGQGNSPEKKRAKAEVVDDKSNDSLHGYSILDLGGDGDCAYRAGAAAYALASNRPKVDVVKNAGQLGATLRAQITSHLRRHAIYESTFVPDSRWTPAREAGVVPRTYSEWIEATARPQRWIDGPCLANQHAPMSQSLFLMSGSYPQLAFRLMLVKLEVSYVLPPDQQGRACPITGCNAALPTLPHQDHKRAVAKHISDCHPGYTPRTLFALRAKIFKKPAVATLLTEKYAKQRAKLYKTHEIVKVDSPERVAKGERGSLYYCKKCLFQLKQDKQGGCHTCTQNLKRMKQKEVVQGQRRMWTNLKKNSPQHAANYAEAVGKTFAELDRIFQVWSITVGRGNGAWEAFQLARKHKIDILALQEDGLKNSERNGFIRHVCKSQYRIYDAPARVRKYQAWGGAMLLVHSRLRSTQIDALSCDDCQCVTVRVENITFSSCYQVPTGVRLPLAQHLTEMQVLMPAGSVFAAVGDFNDTPSETCILQDAASPGLTALFARLANGAPAPTRWEGTRCIDFLVTNSCSNFTPVRLLEAEAIADHKILHFDAVFDTEKTSHPWPLNRKLMPYGLVSFKTSNHYPLFGKLGHAVDTFKVRKIRNFLAQMRERRKLSSLGKENTVEFQSLVTKTTANPLFDRSQDIQSQIRTMETALKHERESQSKCRLDNWRQKLRSSVSACHTWLKTSAPQPFRGLFAESLAVVDATTCLDSSLLLLRDYWKQVWNRPPVDMPAVRGRVLSECQHHNVMPLPNHEWSAVTSDEFASCASRLKGKASGLDGWTGDEISSLPPDAFDLFAKFCVGCETSERLPNAWQLAKQSHLPKASKGLRQADGAHDVGGLRPLSIFSCWYRLWASARLRTSDANAWCQRWWPDQAIGGKKKKEIYNALAPLFDRATRGHYIVSLDFSLAFDFCDPEIAVFIMKQLGLPHGLSTMLLQQWTHQQRLISFQGCCLDAPERVQRSLPQGDPFSLLAMVATLTPCIWEIVRRFPDTELRTFVDDRTWASPSAPEALQVLEVWKSWSDLLQLRENDDKSQFYHKSISGRRSLVDHGAPVTKVTDKPVILGTVFRGACQRRHCDKENTRIDDVLSLIARATFLPVSWQTTRMVVAAGPLANAEFGWCLKPPTLEVCRKVQRAIKKALHEPRYASPDLHDALRGHRLHFGFRALTATFTAARRVLDKEPARLIPGLWDWNLGWSAAIHAMLKRYGWEFISPWHWKHSITHASVALNKRSPHWCSSAESVLHQLREGFRAHSWNLWQNSQRNDNLCCPVMDYNSHRCKLALKQVSGCPDRFAIMTGAYCSPAAYGIATRGNDMCPFCNAAAGLVALMKRFKQDL
ncbi:unnamed protein product, partial [Symbiodinium sp. CCMP2456]